MYAVWHILHPANESTLVQLLIASTNTNDTIIANTNIGNIGNHQFNAACRLAV